jgi:hypothetical protein
MQKVLKNKWISELKNDFPEHAQTIEYLQDSTELILDLAQDYYFCKHQIVMLQRSGKEQLSIQYRETLDELKKELDKLLHINRMK